LNFKLLVGQHVINEIVDVQRNGCPPENFAISVPEDDDFFKEKVCHPLAQIFNEQIWILKLPFSIMKKVLVFLNPVC